MENANRKSNLGNARNPALAFPELRGSFVTMVKRHARAAFPKNFNTSDQERWRLQIRAIEKDRARATVSGVTNHDLLLPSRRETNQGILAALGSLALGCNDSARTGGADAGGAGDAGGSAASWAAGGTRSMTGSYA